MKIKSLKAFSDNYIWLIEEEKSLIVVDPGQAEPVVDYLNKQTKELLAILITHNHDDHHGGVAKLHQLYPNVKIYGPKEVRSYVTQIVQAGDTFTLASHVFSVIDSPGHTAGHISYCVEHHLFCGDAMFSAGCGRVFTGDYQAAYQTLLTFRQLSEDTLIYPGHEYTETNLKFAYEMEPDNIAIQDALKQVKLLRKNHQPSVPSPLKQEGQINLFLMAENLSEFIRLRKARDNF